MSDTIKVVVRVRPIFGSETLWSMNDDSVWLSSCKEKRFCFDRVFDQLSQTSELYDETASSLVGAVMQGFNGTIFAYGQTAAGKTYTMQGDADSPGIIQLSVRAIFEAIENGSNREFLVRVSYLEIYQETVVDLLGDAQKSLSVKENQKGVFVDQLREEVVSEAEQALEHLRRGQENRHVGTTMMNERSSRSHSIFRVMIESRARGADDDTVIVSHLNLVDLAGSENAKAAATSGQRLMEGCHINRSLLSLSRVIHQLSTGARFVNYRDSQLTRILKSSLGGNAKTVMIANVNPVSADETHSTLRFATSAKCVQNKPVVNEVVSGDTMLRRYQKEIEQLRKELQQATYGKLSGNEALQEELVAQQAKINKLTALICVSGQQRKTSRPEPKRRETWCPRMFAQQKPLLSKDSTEGPAAIRKRFSPDLILPVLREKPSGSSSEDDIAPIRRLPSGDMDLEAQQPLFAELKATEETGMTEKVQKLQDEVAELKSSIEKSLAEESRLKHLLADCEKQMVVMATSHKQQIADLKAAKENEVSEEVTKLKNELAENQRTSYQDNLQLKRVLVQCQDEINMKDDKITAMTLEHQRLLDEMKSVEQRSATSEQALKMRITQLQDELADSHKTAYQEDLQLKRVLVQCQDEINMKDDKITAMTLEHQRLLAEMKSYEEKSVANEQDLKLQIAELQEEQTTANEHRVSEEITKLKAEMKSSEERSSTTEKQLREEITELKAELKAANEKEESAEITKLKDELSQNRRTAYLENLQSKRVLVQCQDEIIAKDDKITAMTIEHHKLLAEIKSSEEKNTADVKNLKGQITKLQDDMERIQNANCEEDKRLRDVIDKCEDEITEEKRKMAALSDRYQKEIELKDKELAKEKIKIFTVEEEFRKTRERAESEIRCRTEEMQDMRKRHERREMQLKSEIRKLQNEQNDASVLEAPKKLVSQPAAQMPLSATQSNYVSVQGSERIPVEFQMKMKMHQLTKENTALREQLRHLQGSDQK